MADILPAMVMGASQYCTHKSQRYILMSMYEQELHTAQRIAREAGSVMRRYFDGDQQRQTKADGTPVTIADTTINSLVIQRLHETFPDDGVIGEEESTTGYGLGRKWLCDPVDGTKAFTWGVPTAMFSLALVVDGMPTVGVGYEPMTDRLYWAVRGHGAFCNGTRLQVNRQTLTEGIFAASCSYANIRRHKYYDKLIERKVSTASISGAVAKSVRVAEGRFVGYYAEKVNAYDMAAVHVIVEEAGGKMTSISGQPLNYTQPFCGALVSNGAVHDELMAIVHDECS